MVRRVQGWSRYEISRVSRAQNAYQAMFGDAGYSQLVDQAPPLDNSLARGAAATPCSQERRPRLNSTPFLDKNFLIALTGWAECRLVGSIPPPGVAGSRQALLAVF